MEALANSIKLQYNEHQQPEIVLSTTLPKQEALQQYQKLKQITDKDKLLSVIIKQYRKKRSLDANAYCWIICQKIAEAIGSTKEIVYKKNIREVGQFEIVPIRNDAVETWIERWGHKGLGWFAEVLDDSKLDGYKKVISYYGSSCYDSREMSILIDSIVSEAKELGIETLTPTELAQLKANWMGEQ